MDDGPGYIKTILEKFPWKSMTRTHQDMEGNSQVLVSLPYAIEVYKDCVQEGNYTLNQLSTAFMDKSLWV